MSERRARFENLKENREKLIQFIDQIHVKVAQVMSIKTELAKEIESLKRTSNLDKESLAKEGLNLIKQIRKDFIDLNQFKSHINYKVERENLDPIEKLVNELYKWLLSCNKSNSVKSESKLADITNQLEQSDPNWPNEEFSTDIIENDYFISSKRFDIRSLHSDTVRKEIQKKLNKTTKKEKTTKFKELKFKKETPVKKSGSKTKSAKSDENKENHLENNMPESLRLENFEDVESSTMQAAQLSSVDLNDSKLGLNFDSPMRKSIKKQSSSIKVTLIKDNELFNLSSFPKNLFDDFRAYVDENKKELISILNWN